MEISLEQAYEAALSTIGRLTIENQFLRAELAARDTAASKDQDIE